MKKTVSLSMSMLVSVLAIGACSFQAGKPATIEKGITQSTTSQKNNEFVKDATTQVLIDTQVKKEDIIKVVQHGDHWHVFTKDGKERITYTDPNQEGELAFVSVVPLSQLQGMDVVSIQVHGDHYHVFTKDGREYLTYENPSALFSSISVSEYQGNHMHNVVAIPSNATKHSFDVVRILKHGDHYHVYTRDNQEFVVYSNPQYLYPNAEFGEYIGEHESVIINQPTPIHHDDTNVLPISDNNDDITQPIGPSLPNIIKVVSAKVLKQLTVNKILKHGNHYHVYTVDGKEYLTYDDLSTVFPNITVGVYEGSHTDVTQPPKVENPENTSDKNKNKIVRAAKKRGDYWYLYADVDGKQKVEETTVDPRNTYPNIVILEDNDIADKPTRQPIFAIQDDDLWYLYADLDGTDEVGVMNENPSTRYPNIKLAYEDIFDDTADEDAIPVLAKKHGNHWHLFADLEGKKPIGVVFTDPRALYPDIKIEKYNEETDGKHDQLDDSKEDSSETTDDKQEIPVLAKQHGDHYHLYADLEGKKEVGIIHDDPRKYYPNIKVEQYEGEHENDVVLPDDTDYFEYEDVVAKKIVPLNKPLMHLVAGLVGYADSDSSFGVKHTFGQRVFVVPHIDHYHNISIATIIQLAKTKTFDEFSAKDVVATFKYYIEHPEERPKKAGWGDQVGVEEEMEAPEIIAQKIAYLKQMYHIEDKQDIQQIGNEIKIWSTNPYTTIALSDLVIENGEVKSLIELPNLPK